MSSKELRIRIRSFFPNNKTAAEKIGISPQYLSNILNDRQKPSKKLLDKIMAETSIDNEKWISKSVELLVREAYTRGKRSVVTLAELENNRSLYE